MFSQHCTGQVCALSHSKQKQALEGLRENVKSACLGKLAIGFAIGILASHTHLGDERPSVTLLPVPFCSNYPNHF